MNYFTVYEFMVTELGLKGNELLVYAVIYSFGEMKGGYKYLMSVLGLKHSRVYEILKSLESKGLIFRQSGKYIPLKRKEVSAKTESLIVGNYKGNNKGIYKKTRVEFDSKNTATDETMSKAINELAERLKS